MLKSLLLPIFLLSIVLCLSSCSKPPAKTESMLKFERAVAERESLIARAHEIIDTKVKDDPINNLAHLIYAKEVSLAAEDVFKRANIVGVKQEQILALKQRITAYQPILANYALDLLYQFTDESDALRAKLDEITNLPFVEGKEQSNYDAAVFHRERYNEQVIACCLNPLLTVEPMLSNLANGNYRKIRRLILNANTQQALIARDHELSKAYRKELDKLRDSI